MNIVLLSVCMSPISVGLAGLTRLTFLLSVCMSPISVGLAGQTRLTFHVVALVYPGIVIGGFFFEISNKFKCTKKHSSNRICI